MRANIARIEASILGLIITFRQKKRKIVNNNLIKNLSSKVSNIWIEEGGESLRHEPERATPISLSYHPLKCNPISQYHADKQIEMNDVVRIMYAIFQRFLSYI